MAAVVLERLETGDHGTFGRILFGGLARYTGELPDRGNAPNISCIPAGRYRGLWTFSPAFKRFMYLLEPVDRRSGIRVHAANYMGDAGRGFKKQLNGCVALGERLGWMDGQKAVLLSAPAVRLFETTLKREPFDIEVINAFAS